jgi:hypothetical protein
VVAGLATEETAHGGHVAGAGGEKDDEHVLWRKMLALYSDVLLYRMLEDKGKGSDCQLRMYRQGRHNRSRHI